MAVSKRLRYEILRRDNHACRYCGASAPDIELTIDHVVPVALGGSDEPSNLVAACRDCNAGKSSASADHSLVADVSSDALRWTLAIKQARTEALVRREAQFEIERAVLEIFESFPVPSYKGGGTAADYMPGGWFETISRYLADGLDGDEVTDAARIAVGAWKVKYDGVWPYFCGVCNRKVRDRQDAARAILTAQEPPRAADAVDELGPEEYYAIHQYAALSEVCDSPLFEGRG